MYEYAAYQDGYVFNVYPEQYSMVKPKGTAVEHSITYRRRVVLSKWGIERTKKGYAVNLGRHVFYVR